MKKSELASILRLFNAGLTKAKVREMVGMKPTNFANHLRRLEDLGMIKRIGKYKVEVLSSSLEHPKVTLIPIEKTLNKRGHAFNANLIFPSEQNIRNLPSVQNFLKTNRKAKLLNFGSIKFVYKGNTIWINKKTITIYTNQSYYSADALKSKFRALQDLDNIAKYLKDKFGLVGVYGIEIFREHYGLIFNKFAEWILARREKLEVKNKGNKTILWVDDSKEDDIGLKEFEGDSPLRINKSDKYFDSCERTNWEETPEVQREFRKETSLMIREVTQNQMMFNQNFESHVEAIKTLSQTVKELREEIRNLKKVTKV